MLYSVKLMPRAIKDLKALSTVDAQKIILKIRGLEKGITGDIKKLTNFTPEYRLRVGDYRVLFEIEQQQIFIYRIKQSKRSLFIGKTS